MATTPFKYQAPFPLGPDTTEYYLLTKDYVSVSEFEGTPVLKVEKEGLTAMLMPLSVMFPLCFATRTTSRWLRS